MAYLVTCWRESEDLDLSPCRTYQDAVELGNEHYKEFGFDIEEIEEEDEDEGEDFYGFSNFSDYLRWRNGI